MTPPMSDALSKLDSGREALLPVFLGVLLLFYILNRLRYRSPKRLRLEAPSSKQVLLMTAWLVRRTCFLDSKLPSVLSNYTPRGLRITNNEYYN